MMGPVIIGGGGGGPAEDAEARAGLATLKSRMDALVHEDGVVYQRRHKIGLVDLDTNLTPAELGYTGSEQIEFIYGFNNGDSYENVSLTIPFNTGVPIYQALWMFEHELHYINDIYGFWLGIFGSRITAEMISPHPWPYDLSEHGTGFANVEMYGDAVYFLFGEYFMNISPYAERAEAVPTASLTHAGDSLQEMLEIYFRARIDALAEMHTAQVDVIADLRQRVADLEAAE